MDVTYQLDGKVFLNEIFEDLKLFQNKNQNKDKIIKLSKKIKILTDYFNIKFDFDSIGKLTIQKHKIKSLNEVMNLKSNIIFNCFGFASKFIFPDKNLLKIEFNKLS